MSAARDEPARLAFRRVNYGRGHGYTLNGQKLAGVTTLINDGVPKPGLINWASRMVAEYVADRLADEGATWRGYGRDQLVGLLAGVPSAERDAAGRAGTQVHTLAERLLADEEVEVPEELIGHVDAYLAFLDQWRPTDLLVERPCLSLRHRYAGTFDLIATLPTLGRCLLDIKTARSGIWPETALQLAAYRRADLYQDEAGDLQPMPTVEHTLAIWVRGDGYDLHPVRTDDDVFRTFLYVADVAQNFAKAPRDAFVQPALPPQEVPA